MLTASELREQFASARRTIVVTVDGFGDVALRQLLVDDSLAIAASASRFANAQKPEEMVTFWIELLAKCIVDEKGDKVFDDQEGREILRGLRLDRLTVLGNAAVELNGMDEKKS
jgi:hypothetical protein